MNNEDQHAAFEAWTGYSEEALSRDAGEGYAIKGVDNEWRAWNAAIEHDRKSRGEPVYLLGLDDGSWVETNAATYAWWESAGSAARDRSKRQIRKLYTAPQPAEPVSQHPDDAAVDAFAAAMKAKLAKKRAEGRGNWQMCTSTYLSRLLREHVEKGDPVDVANLAMMLHQNGQRLEPVKVPSDSEDDIVDLLSEYACHNTEHGRMSFDKWTLRDAVSALLARYGNQTQEQP